MNSTVRVKPTQPGSNLRHPAGGRPLADDGDVWPNDGWTQRRLAEGGVVLAPEPPTPVPAADAPTQPDEAPQPSTASPAPAAAPAAKS